MQGYTVYYLHYEDPEFRKPAWNTRQDFVRIVGAKTPDAAINWVKSQFETPIKIMGLGVSKLDDCEILINE
jgi:hypothetical protein